jgi:RNase P/RNase MRP subunit POP5
MTKLCIILIERGMKQKDLQKAIWDSQGVHIGDYRISKMVNGLLTNYHIRTAKLIANTLGVTIDEIVE